MSSRETFCKAFLEAVLNKDLSQKSLSCPFDYIQGILGFIESFFSEWRDPFGPKMACLSGCRLWF